MRRLARFWRIVVTLLRYGVDDIALSRLEHPLLNVLAPIARFGRRFASTSPKAQSSTA